MDIAELSIVMSKSKVEESAGIEIMKMVMETGKKNVTRMTEMTKNHIAYPNLVQHLGLSV